MTEIKKYCEDALHQSRWLHRHGQVKCKLLGPAVLEYEWVEGQMCLDAKLIHDAAIFHIWESPGRCLVADPAAYIAYCRSIHLDGECWDDIYDVIINAQYTPVTSCHGDMTMENAIETEEGNVVFIDPGHTRKLNCRETDEAKLLQSIDGWHKAKYYEDPKVMDPPFEVKPVHWALLATHYGRLLRHASKHTPKSIRYARLRLEELLSC